jgi:hypothetical protein
LLRGIPDSLYEANPLCTGGLLGVDGALLAAGIGLEGVDEEEVGVVILALGAAGVLVGGVDVGVVGGGV